MVSKSIQVRFVGFIVSWTIGPPTNIQSHVWDVFKSINEKWSNVFVRI